MEEKDIDQQVEETVERLKNEPRSGMHVDAGLRDEILEYMDDATKHAEDVGIPGFGSGFRCALMFLSCDHDSETHGLRLSRFIVNAAANEMKHRFGGAKLMESLERLTDTCLERVEETEDEPRDEDESSDEDEPRAWDDDARDHTDHSAESFLDFLLGRQ